MYEPAYLQELFDNLQEHSYDLVSTVTSLGFTRFWRNQGVNTLNLQPGMSVGDFMSGTGEAWRCLLKKIGPEGKIVSLDFSRRMIIRAKNHKDKHRYPSIQVIRGDSTKLPLPSSSLDAIYSGYGVKTFSADLQKEFVEETLRVLKPGGLFSLVEVSVPDSKLLRQLQHFYMYNIMPVALSTFPDNYDRFLEINNYLFDFNGGTSLQNEFRKAGAEVKRTPMTGGLATIISGHKIRRNP